MGWGTKNRALQSNPSPKTTATICFIFGAISKGGGPRFILSSISISDLFSTESSAQSARKLHWTQLSFNRVASEQSVRIRFSSAVSILLGWALLPVAAQAPTQQPAAATQASAQAV